MRFRPLLAAVAAAGLLAAGCDYWRNLVSDNPLATARLKVKVVDMYTLNPLIATCTDSIHGLELKTGTDGEAVTLSAGTGRYTIRCRTKRPYYEKTIDVALTPAGETVEFGLARFGGEEWYKGDTLMEVRIQERFDTLRFPGELAFNAYPADNPFNRFRYEWTFAKAKHLDLTRNDVPSEFPLLLRTPEDLIGMVPGPDTLTLRVWSLMNDPEVPYPIGEYKRPFVWVKNLEPKLIVHAINTGTVDFTVGCPAVDNRVLQFTFSAMDPDGGCPDVRIYTADSSTALGALSQIYDCSKRDVSFPLKNIFAGQEKVDTALSEASEFHVSVTDANGGRYETTLPYSVRSNKLPFIVGNFKYPVSDVFADENIWVYYTAHDLDWAVEEVTTTWGTGNAADSQSTLEYAVRGSLLNTIVDSVPHRYPLSDTGLSRTIHVRVKDHCGYVATKKVGTVKVRKNSLPELRLEYLWPEKDASVFKLTVYDKDKKDSPYLDSIVNVQVAWGDGNSNPVESLFTGNDDWQLIRHQYEKQGVEDTISVTAVDGHGGISQIEKLFKVPQTSPSSGPRP